MSPSTSSSNSRDEWGLAVLAVLRGGDTGMFLSISVSDRDDNEGIDAFLFKSLDIFELSAPSSAGAMGVPCERFASRLRVSPFLVPLSEESLSTLV